MGADWAYCFFAVKVTPALMRERAGERLCVCTIDAWPTCKASEDTPGVSLLWANSKPGGARAILLCALSIQHITFALEFRYAVIRLKRVYDPLAKEDGARFLVDRLWPRGIKKEALQMQAWEKELAPSTELRRWFGHDPAKWAEFQRRYRIELEKNPEGCETLLIAARRGVITLLYSARDTKHNSAVLLKSYLDERL